MRRYDASVGEQRGAERPPSAPLRPAAAIISGGTHSGSRGRHTSAKRQRRWGERESGREREREGEREGERERRRERWRERERRRERWREREKEGEMERERR